MREQALKRVKTIKHGFEDSKLLFFIKSPHKDHFYHSILKKKYKRIKGEDFKVNSLIELKEDIKKIRNLKAKKENKKKSSVNIERTLASSITILRNGVNLNVILDKDVSDLYDCSVRAKSTKEKKRLLL